ncbi:MAG: PTS glucose transporter subunit IIA [Solobacterium sp.]|nr:PTS glucose transporter subunit IIA [Solobacterium sp.]MBQ6356839.1 PTS glucose transporter subunit IIA [Solobacterium sp.]MBQ6532384.1 PTS glucose transporter subunit IIA [Solobacterium sp.]MBR0214120.1 PTS glucose transporter subunit IIA [Solobacterium sp.]
MNNYDDVMAPVAGKVIPLSAVNDPMFAREMLGAGFAVLPEDDVIVSPVAGTLRVVFPSRHVFGVETEHGLKVLVHIGIDTVKAGGAGFTQLAETGAYLRRGEPVIRIDRTALAAYDLTVACTFPGSSLLEFHETEEDGLLMKVGRKAE